MNTQFADTLKRLRMKRDITQAELANLMFVNKSTISKWESGRRMPSVDTIAHLADVLKTDIGILLSASAESDESLNIIMVDDSKPILSYNLLVLEEVVPNAMIAGFQSTKKAVEYAKANRLDLALVDIELGGASGFDLCHALLEINPCTKVVYLTAYPEYSLDAWDTDACGFLVKPLTPESVCRQMEKLHYPISEGGAGE